MTDDSTERSSPRGLTAPEVEESRRKHGSNLLTPPKRTPWWKLYLEKFKDPIIRILIAAAVVALIVGLQHGNAMEGLGILAAILLSTGLSFMNEYRAAKEFDILNKTADDDPVPVIRGGRHQLVPRKDIVVGDVVRMEQGASVPADGRVMEAVALSLNESGLTGESVPVVKAPGDDTADAGLAYPRNIVLRGSTVSDGHGLMEVARVGDETEIGKTARAASETPDAMTPLAKQLERLAGHISIAAFCAAGVIFAAQTVRLAASGGLVWPDALTSLLAAFMLAVTVIVVAVPEGLPMCVTLALAYSMRRMMASNNLVRTMHACETIGAASVICSDKTGTLTMNEMRVRKALFPFLPDGPLPGEGDGADRLHEAASVNATANLLEKDGRTEPMGNPTEAAILLWLKASGRDYERARGNFRVAGQLTFSTERKFMATAGVSAVDGKPVLYAKGAVEILLKFCPRRRDADGTEIPLDDAERERIIRAAAEFQNRGMRILGFASRRVDDDFLSRPVDARLEDMTWDGFFAIADPIRPDVGAAINQALDAGIQVKVVTGDNQATAREIARQAGLWKEGDTDGNIITGDVFDALPDDEAAAAGERIKVMSRSRPLHKLRLVKLLQGRGEVVAVTGDGTNDAPALNHADVGLAMGKTGTAVAKEAADIILLDDSFTSIVNAVAWGRSLYANIQKFVAFQLTINLAAVGIALLGPFLGVTLPLTVTQMLWVNLIMDTFAALALASEPPDWELMKKPPRRSGESIVTGPMRTFIFGVGAAFLGLFLVTALFGSRFPLDPATPDGRHNLTIFFTAFVFVQFWNLWNARVFGSARSAFANLGESRGFLAMAAVIVLGQILLVTFGGDMFRVTPLTAGEWLAIALSTSVVVWVGEVWRWRSRRTRGAAESRA